MNRSIALVISDVDGTLITPDHKVTPRAKEVVRRLNDCGIKFTIASSRPPRGLETIVTTLGMTLPFAPFNGAQIVSPDGIVIKNRVIPVTTIQHVQRISNQFHLNFWVYRSFEWYAQRRDEYVDREQQTVGFYAKIDERIENYFENCPKLTVVGEPEDVEKCEQKILMELSMKIEATRSKPRFLDVTVKGATKGTAVADLSEILHIPVEKIAVMGDGPNDIEMFSRAGASIAMGNASESVKRAARWVTTPNTDEGFANGVEKFILNGNPRRA